jgi:hypothetical protein
MDTRYAETYRPEDFLGVVKRVFDVLQAALGLKSYAVITQGYNYHVEPSLMHVADTGNHVFVGSLGSPFAELSDIDRSVRNALKEGAHGAKELYLAHSFLVTLNIDSYDERERIIASSIPYESKITVPDFRSYTATDFDEIVRLTKSTVRSGSGTRRA